MPLKRRQTMPRRVKRMNAPPIGKKPRIERKFGVGAPVNLFWRAIWRICSAGWKSDRVALPCIFLGADDRWDVFWAVPYIAARQKWLETWSIAPAMDGYRAGCGEIFHSCASATAASETARFSDCCSEGALVCERWKIGVRW